jgi:hypothetical protein
MYEQSLCFVKMVPFENTFVNIFTLCVSIRSNTNTPTLMCMLLYNTGDAQIVNPLWIWNVWHTRRSVIFVMVAVREWGNWSLLHPTRRVVQIPRRTFVSVTYESQRMGFMHTPNACPFAWIVWKCAKNYQITPQDCYRVSSSVRTHKHVYKTEPIKKI